MEDDDTIELQLSPQEMEALVRAAAPEPSAFPAPARPRSFEGHMRAIRVPAIVSVAVFAISLGGFKYVAMSREQDVPVAPAPASAPRTPQAPVATPTDGVPVRFSNPFDDSEVFDFPPGTSEAEARAAVAALLLQRARDRVQTPGVQLASDTR